MEKPDFGELANLHSLTHMAGLYLELATHEDLLWRSPFVANSLGVREP